jgi:hypothetical protein
VGVFGLGIGLNHDRHNGHDHDRYDDDDQHHRVVERLQGCTPRAPPRSQACAPMTV